MRNVRIRIDDNDILTITVDLKATAELAERGKKDLDGKGHYALKATTGSWARLWNSDGTPREESLMLYCGIKQEIPVTTLLERLLHVALVRDIPDTDRFIVGACLNALNGSSRQLYQYLAQYPVPCERIPDPEE